MAISKFIYGGEVKFDLTADTVSADVLLSGHTAHGKDGEAITGTCSYDSDTSSATVAVAEILDGKTAYARGAKLTGTMPNNGDVTGTISTKAGQYTIPQGYHSGAGKVSISASAVQGLTAGNIRSGVTILGVTGSMSGSEGITAESKTVTPTTSQQSVVPTGATYLSSVTVNAIPYSEAPNSAGGTTVTIG